MKVFVRTMALGVLLISCPASANDSTARVATGGLVLEKTNDIEMVSEVLEISPEKIRVTYHFLNTSTKDIETTVAFPTPAYYPTMDSDLGPIDGFQTTVDGRKVAMSKERKFLAGDVDVTDKLRKIGLPDAKIFDAGFNCWDGPGIQPCVLPKKQVDAINDLKKHMNGGGQIQETAYWKQIFPAGKDIGIVHEYKPFAGNQPGTPPTDDPDADCLDARMRKLINKRSEGNVYPVRVKDVEYILGTGRNWKGPIKHFKLILKKEYAGQLVSLCFPGKPKKTSPTAIEFTQTEYVPQDRLIVYFYN